MHHLSITHSLNKQDQLHRASNILKEQSSRSLILMVRSPSDKRVKSRLAATLGQKFAANFYRRCVEHIIQETGEMFAPVQRYIFYTNEGDDSIRSWLGDNFYYVPQHNGPLGVRIEHAFDTVFHAGSERAIIIATDVPELTSRVLDEAISMLDIYDIVIGPSYDGGYYLLGMKSPHPSLFADIAWSTASVYRETMSHIRTDKLSCYYLPALRDIDTQDDLRDWLANPGSNDHVADKLVEEYKLAELRKKDD